MEVLSISELLLSILRYTDMGTLMACFEVNKQFSNLCRHDTIWKELLEGDFDWQYQNLPKEFTSYYSYYAHLDKTMRYYKETKATIHELNTEDHPLLIEGKNLLDEIGYVHIYDHADITQTIQKIKSYVPNMNKGDLIKYSEYSESDDNRYVFIYNGKDVELLTFDREESENGYCYCSNTTIGAIPIKYSVPHLYPLSYWGTELWICVPFDPYPYLDQMVENYSALSVDYYGRKGDISVEESCPSVSSHTWFVYNHIHFLVVINDVIAKNEIREYLKVSSYSIHPYFDDGLTLLVDDDY